MEGIKCSTAITTFVFQTSFQEQPVSCQLFGAEFAVKPSEDKSDGSIVDVPKIIGNPDHLQPQWVYPASSTQPHPVSSLYSYTQPCYTLIQQTTFLKTFLGVISCNSPHLHQACLYTCMQPLHIPTPGFSIHYYSAFLHNTHIQLHSNEQITTVLSQSRIQMFCQSYPVFLSRFATYSTSLIYFTTISPVVPWCPQQRWWQH